MADMVQLKQKRARQMRANQDGGKMRTYDEKGQRMLQGFMCCTVYGRISSGEKLVAQVVLPYDLMRRGFRAVLDSLYPVWEKAVCVADACPDSVYTDYK